MDSHSSSPNIAAPRFIASEMAASMMMAPSATAAGGRGSWPSGNSRIAAADKYGQRQFHWGSAVPDFMRSPNAAFSPPPQSNHKNSPNSPPTGQLHGAARRPATAVVSPLHWSGSSDGAGPYRGGGMVAPTSTSVAASKAPSSRFTDRLPQLPPKSGNGMQLRTGAGSLPTLHSGQHSTTVPTGQSPHLTSTSSIGHCAESPLSHAAPPNGGASAPLSSISGVASTRPDSMPAILAALKQSRRFHLPESASTAAARVRMHRRHQQPTVRFFVGPNQTVFNLPASSLTVSRMLAQVVKCAPSFLEGAAAHSANEIDCEGGAAAGGVPLPEITLPTINADVFEVAQHAILRPKGPWDPVPEALCLEVAMAALYLDLPALGAASIAVAAQNVRDLPPLDALPVPLIRAILRLLGPADLRVAVAQLVCEPETRAAVDVYPLWLDHLSSRVTAATSLVTDAAEHCDLGRTDSIQDFLDPQDRHYFANRDLIHAPAVLRLPHTVGADDVRFFRLLARKHHVEVHIRLVHTILGEGFDTPNAKSKVTSSTSAARQDNAERGHPGACATKRDCRLRQEDPQIHVKKPHSKPEVTRAKEGEGDDDAEDSTAVSLNECSDHLLLVGSNVQWSAQRVQLLQGLPVTSLTLDECSLAVGGPQLQFLCQWLESAHCGLKRLVIRRSLAEDALARVLASAAKCRTLRALDVSDNVVQAQPSSADKTVLRGIRGLQVRCGSSSGADPDMGVTEFAMGANIFLPAQTLALLGDLTAWDFLASLDLRHMQLGHQLEPARLLQLTAWPRLRRLQLAGNRLTARTLVGLVELVADHPHLSRNLQHLDIAENQITGAVLAAIEARWNDMLSLHELVLNLPRPDSGTAIMNPSGASASCNGSVAGSTGATASTVPPSTYDSFLDTIAPGLSQVDSNDTTAGGPPQFVQPRLTHLSLRGHALAEPSVRRLAELMLRTHFTLIMSPLARWQTPILKRAVTTSQFNVTVWSQPILTNARR